MVEQEERRGHMGRARLTDPRRLEQAAQEYFEDTANRPYSMLELCWHLGVEYSTLCLWEKGSNKQLAGLARQSKQRIAACWEKGELPAALATHLLKQYFGEGQAEQQMEITLKVVGDEL